jgi:hypothetical protein
MEMNKRKKILMEYYNFEEGIIDFYIITNYTNRSKRISLTFWNTWDNFDEFIEWMEKVLKGDNDSVYEHRPEDLSFYFKYCNGIFYVYEWQESIENYLIEIEVNNVDLIFELYFSFRNFIESEKYNFILWEGLTFQDIFEIKYGTIEKAMEKLIEMKHLQIIDLMNKYTKEYEVEDDIFGYYDYEVFKDMDNLENEEKIKYIVDNIFSESFGFENGLKLRKNKSRFIEEYFNNNAK